MHKTAFFVSSHKIKHTEVNKFTSDWLQQSETNIQTKKKYFETQKKKKTFSISSSYFFYINVQQTFWRKIEQ